ncbi:MAG: copper resistance CopC family protein [Candidatus Limnocylindrales bacterium]
MTIPHLRSRVSGALIATVLLLVSLPATVGAHAALDTATPADGATVEGNPAEVAGTYTQSLETDGSSLQLRDSGGTVIATGGVDPADDHRLVIADLPPLAAGEYEVRSTTLSAEDGEVVRATWTFTVTAAAASPTPAPSAEPTLAPSADPTAAPTATAAPTPTDHEIPTGASDSDAILPIIAGLAIVLIAGVVLLGRRGRTGRGT